MSDTPDRPSIVLHGFDGGIVNGPDIAVRLAQIILADPTGPVGPLVGLPLRATEVGDRWLITEGSEGSRADCCIEIQKRDAAVFSVAGVPPTDAVPNSVTAERLAAILADNAGFPGESGRQAPFTVIDNDNVWIIRGSYNAGRAVEGLGRFCAEIRKRDARVLDIGFEEVIHTPATVKELLRTNASKAPRQS